MCFTRNVVSRRAATWSCLTVILSRLIFETCDPLDAVVALLEAVTDSCEHKCCDIPQHFSDGATTSKRDLTLCEETPSEVLPILPGPVVVVVVPALPRFKNFLFQEAGHSFGLPKSLALSSVAVRVLYTCYDHLSPLWVQCQGLPRQEAPDIQDSAEHPKDTGQEPGEEEEKGSEEPSVPAAEETCPEGRKVSKKTSSKDILHLKLSQSPVQDSQILKCFIGKGSLCQQCHRSSQGNGNMERRKGSLDRMCGWYLVGGLREGSNMKCHFQIFL